MFRSPARLWAVLALLASPVLAAPDFRADPLAAVDLNRTAIVADILAGYEAGLDSLSPVAKAEARLALGKRLSALRADRLLAASLATSRESLELALAESEKATAAGASAAKAFGDASRDLLYTPLTPCRLIDTRGYGAPIQGGAFAPNERRSYAPAGGCGLPVTGVASILVSFTTQNLTTSSGGYLAILAPAAPVTASVDIFNLGAEWSASNTAVVTGTAAQFDVLVAAANAHVVVDVLGYFSAPAAGSIAGTLITDSTITTAKLANASVTVAKLASSGCTNGQVLKYNGSAWACAADADTNSGGTVTSVATGPGLTGGPITATGTVGLATTQLLPTTACAADQVARWTGGAWVCASSVSTMTGRVTNPGNQVVCIIGAPSGLSVTGACSAAGIVSVGGLIRTGYRVANLRTRIGAAIATNLRVVVSVSLGSTVSLATECTIAAGQTTCAGPSYWYTIPIDGHLAVEVDPSNGGASPAVSFVYELMAP